jgi:integrase/recombinase XerD
MTAMGYAPAAVVVPLRPSDAAALDIEAVFAEWQMWMRAQGLAERTIVERVQMVRRVAERSEGDPVTLTAQQITRVLAGRMSQGTRATYWQLLRAWCRWLVLTGRRHDDPTLLMPRPRVARGRPRPVTTEQLDRLLATRMHRRTRAMIVLAAFQGLRVHEIAKFAGRDVDITSSTMRVVGKGGVDAELPLHPMTQDVADYMPHSGWWFPAYKPNREFPNGDGHVLSRSVSTIVGNAMERAGVPGTPHALRHWYGTEMLRASGGNLRVAQEMLRHASPQTTAIYTQVDDSERRAAMMAMPALSGGFR